MPGSSIADSVQHRKTTVIARPQDGGFYLQPNTTHRMLVGDGGTYVGYNRGAAGDLSPKQWSGFEIDALLVLNTDDIAFRFVDGVQIPGVNSILVSAQSSSPYELTWSISDYRVNVPGKFAIESARIGETIGFRFGKYS